MVPHCGITDDTPCRFGDAGRTTFLPWFVPRTELPMQLREVGPDMGHLLTESCSDVHLHVCRCRTRGEDCCCCSLGSRHQNITACTGVIVLLDRGCCSSVYCSSTGCCSSTCWCCCCCCCGRCSSTRRWWSTGSHPTESLVEQACVSSGYWICVCHGPKAAVPRNPDGKKQRKTNNECQQITSVYAYAPFSAGQHMGRFGPAHVIGRAGPYRARVSWASLPCDRPGRAGPS